MRRALATTFIAALAVASMPGALRAQTESPPASATSPAPLPEIGRTRATSAACAAMRDVVIPAFAGSRRADMRFDAVHADLPAYIQLKSGATDQHVPVSGVNTLESQYAKLGADVASLLRETDGIRKLLDDPRLSPSSTDPVIKALRAQLEQLYAVQQARAAYLSQLMLRESNSLGKNMVGWENPSDFVVPAMPRDPQRRTAPAMTPPPGMPLLNGFEAADRERLESWSASQARTVHATEEQAAKTFYPIAQSCR